MARVAGAVTDRILAVFVAALAIWTVLFQLALAFDVERDPTTVAWVVAAVVAAAILIRLGPDDDVDADAGAGHRRERAPWEPVRWWPLVTTGIALAAVVGARDVTGGRWPLAWLAMAAFGVAALWVALTGAWPRGAAGSRARPPGSGPSVPGAAGAEPWLGHTAAPITANPTTETTTAELLTMEWPGSAGHRRRTSRAATADTTSAIGAVVVVVAALAFAFLSLITSRPDLDDVFVVNRASWIESHDTTFPERDTIFSDERFAVERPATPQTAIEALVGSVAAWLPVSAAGLGYLWLAPIVSALAVLALWRLVVGLGATQPALAVIAGLVFVLVDGESAQSFGNFHFARAWQGKTILVMVLVPVLWRATLEVGRRGSRYHAVVAVAAAVAAVGCSTSATFVVPPVIVIGLTAGAMSGRRWAPALATAAAALAAPVAAGVANLAASPQSASPVLAFIDFGFGPGDVDPAGQLRLVAGHGLPLAVTVAVILVGWAFAARWSGRVAMAAASLAVVGVALAPGVLGRLDGLSSAESVLWRVLWVMPVPALAGLVAAGMATVALRSLPSGSLAVIPAAVLAAMALWGQPVLSPDNGDLEVAWPPPLDLPEPELTAAETLRSLVPDGSTVGAPQPVGYPLSVITTDVRPVNPRWRYLAGRHAVPAFQADARDTVSRWLTDGVPADGVDRFVAALESLSVSAACADVDAGGVTAAALEAAGFMPAGSDEICDYWVATTVAAP